MSKPRKFSILSELRGLKDVIRKNKTWDYTKFTNMTFDQCSALDANQKKQLAKMNLLKQ